MLTGGIHGTFKNTSKAERLRVLEANKPLWTTIDLLEKLKNVFAADYRIIDGVLYFERLDYFDKIRNTKLLNTKDYCLEDSICIEYDNLDDCAYGEYQYSDDFYDKEGQAIKAYQYKGILDFNKPYNPNQKGKCQRLIDFSAARFMFDRVSYEDKGFFNFRRKMDEFRDGEDSFFADVFFDNEGLVRTRDLTLSGNTLSTHKLLVLEDGFDYNDAQTIRKPYKKDNGKQFWVYNYPMHIDSEADYNELTKDFLWIDNPRLKKDRYKLSDFEVECDCGLIGVILKNFQNIYIQTPICKAIPQIINISFENSKIRISFKNIIGLCE